jgi:HJR/Mrr/RecB family endonuclease
VKGGAGDLAADIVCRDSAGQSVVVQCKQYGIERKVTSQEMQLFIGMGRIEHRAERLLYVTTGDYTKAAADLGRKHGVELFNGTQLESLGRDSNKH